MRHSKLNAYHLVFFCLFSRVENVHMVCSSTVIKCKNMRFDTDFMQALVNWPHDSYAQFNLN